MRSARKRRGPDAKPTGRTPESSSSRPFRPGSVSCDFFLIALLTVLFFYKVFLHPGLMLWGSDLVRLDSLYKCIEWRSFHEWGRFPLWEPTSFCGMSKTGDQGPVFITPFVIPFWLSSSLSVFGFYLWLQVLLGAWGTYLFARRKGCSALGATFSSIAFAFCGRVAGHLFAGHVGMVPAALGLPWILWATERLLTGKRIREAVLLGAVAAFAAVNGPSIQVVYYNFLFAVGYVVVHLLGEYWAERNLRVLARPISLFAVSALVSTGASAAWWVPVIRQTLLLSARAGVREMDFSTIGSASPIDLLRLVWPFFGVPLPQAFRSDIEHQFFWATANYVGVTTLCLGVAAAFALRKRAGIKGFAILGLIATLLALGKYSPLYWLSFHLLPGFSMFRVPGRLFLYTDFVLAILAGLFLTEGKQSRLGGVAPGVAAVMLQGALLLLLALRDANFGPAGSRWLPLFILTVLAFVGTFWALGYLSDRFWGYACLCVLIGEMFIFWQPHVQMVESEKALPSFSAARFLEDRREEEEFRILDTTGMIPQQIAVRDGLEIVTGYRASVYGYYLDLYSKIWRRDSSDIVEVELHSPRDIVCPTILDLMNVRYLISLNPELGSDYEKVYETPPDELRQVHYIYRRETALPRAYLVANADVPPAGMAVLDAICLIEPRQECLVEEDPIQGTASFQELAFRRSSFSDITMHFSTQGPGVAVVSQSWHPDWRATDNGRSVEVRRVNHAQVGVPVGPGTHELRVWYFPWDFYLGCGIAGATWVCVVIFFAVLGYRERRRRVQLSHGAE